MNLSDRLARLSPEKRALLEQRLLAAQTASRSIPEGDPSLLSYSEQRLWFVDQLEPNHPFYNLPLAARLDGALDQPAFWSALQEVVDRHESLRSTYHWNGGDVERKIHAHVTLAREYKDLSAASSDAVADTAGDETTTASVLREQMRLDAQRPFSLEQPPLLRCILYRLGPRRHVALLVMHHIICDGWSMAVLLRELAAFYDAALRTVSSGAAPSPLPPPPHQYRDFATWQRQREQQETMRRGLEYWRGVLQGAPRLLHLPADHPRPAIQDFEGALEEFTFDESLLASLKRFAQTENATEFMVLLAAYAALLDRLTDQQDFCIGSVTANRQLPEWEHLIGFFVNTLVMRINTQGAETFRELAGRARQVAIDANAHDDVPLEKLVEELIGERDRSHSPLFQTALVVQNAPLDFPVGGGLRIQPLEIDNATAKYDLTWFFWESEGRLRGRVEYRTTLFEASTIRSWIESFQTLLRDALQHPDAPLADRQALSETQRTTLLQWGAHPRAFGPPALLSELVLRWADVRGDAPAVVGGDIRWSYSELRRQVLAATVALRHRVQQQDPPADLPEQPRVVVNLPRSPEQVACMLAVMQAGYVYVPVDPDQPRDRIQYMVEDSQASLVIDAQGEEAYGAVPAVSYQQLLADTEANAVSNAEELASPERPPSSDRIAYLIYTSGTSGRPKGVVIAHHGIVNFIRGHIERMGVGQDDRVLHGLSPCFDGGLSEVCLGLVSGACLVIAPRETVLDPRLLAGLIAKQRVSVGKFPPTLLATLEPDDVPSMTTVSTGGEALNGELAERWLAGRRFFNGYGPTEVSVGVCMHEVKSPPPARPPIGTPLANARIYVLDEHRQLLPAGVIGEIYLGGPGVAVGYWRQPELTREKFLPDPFAETPGARMYRTGDLGRWSKAGVLEFQGRVDQQIKLRGYRIEPAEIAARITESPLVDQAVVVARGDAPGGERLVAYWIAARDRSRQQQADRGQVENWLELFQTTHRSAPPSLDPELNITGWISSFDGRPLPAAEMRAWAEETAANVLRLRPQRLWEIGCGTGLILFRVIHGVGEYFGTDFLQSSLQQLEKYLQHRQDISDKVRLEQREANRFDQPPPFMPDVIVMNSVAQYFPSVDYFFEVLHGLLETAEAGGRVFLGDLRNLDLHRTLAIAIEASRASADTPAATLLQRVQQRLRREEELLLSPELFRQLPRWFSRVKHVEVRWKAADADNELTRYRYDVTLHLDAPPRRRTLETNETNEVNEATSAPVDESAWPDVFARCEHGVVRGAPHRALQRDAQLWDALSAAGKEPVGAVLQRVENSLAPGGILPSQLVALGRELHREVVCEPDPDDSCLIKVSWSPIEAPLETSEEGGSVVAGDVARHAASTVPAAWRSWTNQPSADVREQEIVDSVKSRLREVLPDYMIPTAWVRIAQMPRTVQGKVDVLALPAPPALRGGGGDYVAPETEHERLVAEVWERLLDVRPVGKRDDFFALGGHSMLAVRVMAEIEKASGRRLPLASLFQHPTVEHLAHLLDSPAEESMSCLAPLNQITTGEPLYLVHPAGGAVFCYLDLASQFRNRPVIGVQAVGIDGLQQPHDNVEAMAEHYIHAIREHQPQGPYHLAGWSLGGNLAYEMARRLKEQGAEVGLVGLLDAAATPPVESLQEEDFLKLLVALFPGQQALPLEDLRRLEPEQQLKFFLERAAQAGLAPPQDEEAGRRVFHVFQTNVKALHQHRTQTYHGPVVLFRASEQTTAHELAQDEALGWRQWAQGGVTVIPTSGNHAQMVHHPHAAELAEKIEKVLQ